MSASAERITLRSAAVKLRDAQDELRQVETALATTKRVAWTVAAARLRNAAHELALMIEEASDV